MRLGLLPHDPLAVAAVPLHYAATLPPAAGLGRIKGIPFTPSLVDNNDLPTCVAAFLLNSVRGSAWAKTGADVFSAERKAVTFYAEVAGCADDFVSVAASDGVQMLTAFQRAASYGFDIGQQVPLYPSWERCETDDRWALAHGAMAGLTGLGVNLAAADRPLSGRWDTATPASQGDPAPGSWGPHCLGLWDWDGFAADSTVWLATWGILQPATWRWVASRLVNGEAYAFDWRQEVAA